MNQRLPTGFPALDLILGGGLRREDLVVLGGDSGSGCSSLALGIAVRVAQQGHAVAMLSTEMSATRFGLLLARDPNLVREMRAGRQPRAGLRRRIEAMLAGDVA